MQLQLLIDSWTDFKLSLLLWVAARGNVEFVWSKYKALVMTILWFLSHRIFSYLFYVESRIVIEVKVVM